eukprot:XP_011683800.1 PREDICTED: slit homolog 2 protein-like [Strongylocentrotus purpuratus]
MTRMSGLYSILFVIITLISIHRRATVEAASCYQDFSLKAAFCSDEGFRSVPTDLLPDLRELYLHDNLLTTLTNETFERYPSLWVLSLDNNNISRIDEGAFNPLKNLFRLSIGYNLYLPTLKKETIEAASCHQDFSLKVAFCSDNGFRSVPTDLLPDLRELYLEDNLLTTLTNETFERYPSLRVLSLDNNNISRIEEGAKLHTIQNGLFAPLKGKNLDKIDIEMNSIYMIEDNGFDGLAGVSELQLGSNNLEEIEPSVFNGMMALRTLSLDANRILTLNKNDLTYLDSNLFKYLSNLVYLDASVNRISGLNRSTFEPLARLTKLKLSLNPLVCNCDLKWLPGWLKGKVELIDSMHTICLDNAVTLEPFRGKQLITFDPKDECGPNIILYSCLAILGMVLIFALGLIYYQRWWIRYRLFLLKLCFIGYEEIHDNVDRGEFHYDIAIMLDEADDVWVNQHLKPALLERVSRFQSNSFVVMKSSCLWNKRLPGMGAGW